jgi:hypothetical protein
MEAAGIEPASEDIQRRASTCVSSSLISLRFSEEEEIHGASPVGFRLPGPGLIRLAIPLGDASREPRESVPGNG